MKPAVTPPKAQTKPFGQIERWLPWLFSLVLWAILLVLLLNRQALTDWWILRHYHPTATVQAFVNQDGLNNQGQRMLFLGQAEIDDKAAFNSHCRQGELRQSLVLGCFTSNHIYVLRINQAELRSVMSVTAAHEMLHNAYSRLGQAEKNQVNAMIESYYHRLHDPAIQRLVALYNKTEPGQLLNELHSILPTEVAHLSPELESYYGRYFSDRTKVVAAFAAYQNVFTRLDQQRADLISQLTGLKNQLNDLKAQYQAAASQATSLTNQINQLRQSGQVAKSNRLVPAQNAAATAANRLADKIKAQVAAYNALVVQVNQLAFEQNDLVASLNSTDYTH